MNFSIVNYKTVKEQSDSLRIDADFYRDDSFRYLQKIDKKEKYYLKNIMLPTEIKRTYEEDGIQILLAQNIKNNRLDFKNVAFMNKSFKKELIRNKLEYDDVVITRSGANFGQTAAYKIKREIFASIDMLVIKNINEIKGGYLSTFFNTKQGQNLLNRGSYGMAQPHLSPSYLYQLPIPRFNPNFENLIDILINDSEKCREDSQVLYHQTEKLVLSECKLDIWSPKHQLSFVRHYFDTKQSERIDAEYYQPKYNEIIAVIKNYKGGWDLIKNQFKLNKSSFNIIQGNMYNYLEISGVNVLNGEIDIINVQASELPVNAKIKLEKGNLVVSRVRTYRGAVAIIDRDSLIGSGAFTVLQENGVINKETLLVLLKSLPYSQLSLKFSRGTSYPVLMDKDILNFPIPIFEKQFQNIVVDNISFSIKLLQKSNVLLEIAKKSVEMAIELDESIAEKWINEELKKI